MKSQGWQGLRSRVTQQMTQQTTWLRSTVKAGLAVSLAFTGMGQMAINAQPALANDLTSAGQVYLFGESPQRDQLGQTYFIFRKVGDRIVGAIYAPRSSFDCFQGAVQGNQLKIDVVDSYTRQVYPVAISLERNSVVAGNLQNTVDFKLEGLYPIADISQNDQRILAVCQADFQ